MNGYEYLLETARQELDAAVAYQNDRNPAEHDNALRRAAAYAAVAQAAALCRIADALATPHRPGMGDTR